MVNLKLIFLAGIILAGALYLLFANVNNQYLWQDEAETALVSKTILTEGLPRGYDGKNYFSQMAGADCGPSYIWRHHNWLSFYILAGFYKVFGINTFTSRLPFLIFGFGTILLTYFFVKSLLSNSRIAIIAILLLTLSVPFLLLCRQCRYYSLVMFFTVLCLHSYNLFLKRTKYSGVMLIISTTLLFHSQHLYIIIFFASIWVHAFIFYRDRIKGILILSIIAAVINVPWIIWLSTALKNPSSNFIPDISFKTMIGVLGSYIVQVNRYAFPFLLLLVPAVVLLIKKIEIKKYISQNRLQLDRILLLVFFIIFNILFLTVVTPDPYFRYLAASIPLFVILTAVIIELLISVHFLPAIAVVLILVGFSQLKDYFYEITHDYDGPIEGIVKYLNEHAEPNDIVAITYGDLPLKFYTKLRIVGGQTGEDLTPAKQARWIIFRKYTHSMYDKQVQNYLLTNTDGSKYRQIVINYPDTAWQNREDPAFHHFRTDTKEDKVIIFERKD